MASSSQDPSSSSTSIHSFSFDVFLSFRGEDTRYNFTDHLFKNLSVTGINTFKDDQLERGEEINPQLLKTIEESRISIVVLSKNYADSKWCLDELAKIMECRKEMKQTVLPMFYHVDPSDVRKQTGSFGVAFSTHKRKVDAKKVQKWRDSLTEAANLSGFHVNNESEAAVIDDITDKISEILDLKSSYVGENMVGMNIRLEKLKSLINIDSNNVLMVGICGIGGLGKTTIAKALCEEISSQFKGVSFLANVREKSKNDCDLLHLQQQLLNDILKGKNWQISNVLEGMKVIKNKLSLRRVLVVLDDVDNLKQLEHLVGNKDWFGQGSRILITTRDKHLLDAHKVDKYHEIEELNAEEALHLFSLYAFKQNFPQEDYKDLSKNMVKYAKGLLLALKVLGSLLCKKTKPQWESELLKLKREPALEIQKVLKISFDGLEHTEKEIFLDIACFFKGQDKDSVSRILDGCDFYAEIGIRNLCDKSLITILDNKIHMHDLIQQMGWKIIREQYPKEPGKWSRLWELNDVSHVLTGNMGTEAIEGIFLDMSTSEQMQFTTQAFKMMNKLRLLIVHQGDNYSAEEQYRSPGVPFELHLSSRVNLCRYFEFPSQELRCLHWDGYPFESLPSNFYAKNLIQLNLRYSNIMRLWTPKPLANLKVIDLSHSKHLKEIPNPLSVPNLEILNLQGCSSLESLPRRIYKLRRLKTLSCRGCVNLSSFPEIMSNMENLRQLDLHATAIVNLPSSIEHLKGLEYLGCAQCYELITVPQNICNLTCLTFLCFSGCWKIEKLPEDLKGLECLKVLYLDGVKCPLPSVSGLRSLRGLYLSLSNLTQGVIQSNNLLSNLKELWLGGSKGIDKGILISICHLSSLEKLYLSNCNLMDGVIPSELWRLSSLEELDLSWNHFSIIPASISQLSKLKALGLSHCKKLRQIPELPSTLQFLDVHNSHFTLSNPSSFLPSSFSKFQDFVRYGGSAGFHLNDSSSYFEEGVSILIPGIGGIPEWIKDQNKGNHATIDLPEDWYECKDFLGFALFLAYNPLDGFEHESQDESEIQFENEPDHDEWAHESEDESVDESEDESVDESVDKSVNESEDGSAYKSDDRSEDASESSFEGAFWLYPEDPSFCDLNCELTLHGDQPAFLNSLLLGSYCQCHENDGASGKVWVLCYPKFAIEEKYRSNKWRRLKASIHGRFQGMQLKVECGMQLIYAKNDEYNRPALIPTP